MKSFCHPRNALVYINHVVLCLRRRAVRRLNLVFLKTNRLIFLIRTTDRKFLIRAFLHKREALNGFFNSFVKIFICDHLRTIQKNCLIQIK